MKNFEVEVLIPFTILTSAANHNVAASKAKTEALRLQARLGCKQRDCTIVHTKVKP